MYFLERIFLNRRRILFGTSLIFACVLVRQFASGQDMLSVALAKAGLVALAFATVVSLVIAILPSMRFVCEVLGLWYFGETLLNATLLPGLTARIHDNTSGLILLFVGLAALQQILYGAWWRRLPWRGSITLRSHFWTSASPSATWAALVPDSDNLNAYYAGNLVGFDAVEGHSDTFIKKTAVGPAAFVEEYQYVTEHTSGERIALEFWTGTPDTQSGEFGGKWSLRLVPSGQGTDVEITEQVTCAPMNNILLFWFDDLGRQVSASMIAALEGKKSDASLLGWARKNAGLANT